MGRVTGRGNVQLETLHSPYSGVKWSEGGEGGESGFRGDLANWALTGGRGGDGAGDGFDAGDVEEVEMDGALGEAGYWIGIDLNDEGRFANRHEVRVGDFKSAVVRHGYPKGLEVWTAEKGANLGREHGRSRLQQLTSHRNVGGGPQPAGVTF